VRCVVAMHVLDENIVNTPSMKGEVKPKCVVGFEHAMWKEGRWLSWWLKTLNIPKQTLNITTHL